LLLLLLVKKYNNDNKFVTIILYVCDISLLSLSHKITSDNYF